MIKKEIHRSKKLAALISDAHRMLYLMIYPHVDVDGRFSADPADIKLECVPLIERTGKTTIAGALVDMADKGLINLYPDPEDGETWFLEITRFHDFQSLRRNREAPSRIPANNSGSGPGLLREYSGKFPLSKEVINKVMGKYKNTTTKEVINLDISFDPENRVFNNITPEDIKTWREAFPGVDIRHELRGMVAWLMADWPRRKKIKWKSFITRWLRRAQDRGPTRMAANTGTWARSRENGRGE